MPESTFKLCITMAGAVSAGAYTAGVMDELLEVLALWEKAKLRNRELGKEHPDYDHSLPMHKVVIEVMSGASAGGITAVLSALKMTGHPKKDQILHDCWVNMADEELQNTALQLLNSSDLEKKGAPASLLNGAPLDHLAQKHIYHFNSPTTDPWFSDDADVLLTATHLPGLGSTIGFHNQNKVKKGQRITGHHLVYHYRLGQEKQEPGSASFAILPLHPEQKQSTDQLRAAALSTSAFPIGLPGRKMTLPADYLQNLMIRKFNGSAEVTPDPITPADETFETIDGGLLNNEPYGIGVRALQEKLKASAESGNHAVIMIDPLPQGGPSPNTRQRWDIPRTALGMFRALRNQVMFNQEGIVEAVSLKNRTRFLIAPSKPDPKTEAPDSEPLASGKLHGFAGFLSKGYRSHDYKLGRKNCQDFIRFHFTIPETDAGTRLGIQPTPTLTARFAVFSRPENDPKILFLPIIPDVRLQEARTNTLKPDIDPVKGKRQFPTSPAPEPHLKATLKKPLKKRIYLLFRAFNNRCWLNLIFRLFFLNKSVNYLLQQLDQEQRSA